MSHDDGWFTTTGIEVVAPPGEIRAWNSPHASPAHASPQHSQRSANPQRHPPGKPPPQLQMHRAP